MAKAKDKADAQTDAPASNVPSIGDVALRLLSVDSQIFSAYEHKFVAMKVKILAQLVIDGAGELALDVAGLLAPRIFQFATVNGAEEAFKQSVANMLEVALIAHDFISDKPPEPALAAAPTPPVPPAAQADQTPPQGATGDVGQVTGQQAAPQA